jgi:dihydroxyacetone kinase
MPRVDGASLATTSTGVDESAQDDDGPGGVAGERARAALRQALTAIEAMEGELGRLDAAAGDGDHGAGMVRGLRAAVTAIDGYQGTARQSFSRAGVAFQNAAGGASGALVGAWVIAIGSGLPPDDAEVDAVAVASAMRGALEALQRLGEAQPGDKTMIDTLAPFTAALEAAAARGDGLVAAWATALPAAEAGMVSTTDMVSRRGRASRLGERSRGVQDAGATSIYHVLRAFGEGIRE